MPPAGFGLYFPGYDGGEAATGRRAQRIHRPLREGEAVGINRFSDIEERKRNETDAKAGDELPKEKKGDASSRVEASEGPVENPEKRRALEKLKEQEQDS
jgi:hypothetical protein